MKESNLNFSMFGSVKSHESINKSKIGLNDFNAPDRSGIEENSIVNPSKEVNLSMFGSVLSNKSEKKMNFDEYVGIRKEENILSKISENKINLSAFGDALKNSSVHSKSGLNFDDFLQQKSMIEGQKSMKQSEKGVNLSMFDAAVSNKSIENSQLYGDGSAIEKSKVKEKSINLSMFDDAKSRNSQQLSASGVNFDEFIGAPKKSDQSWKSKVNVEPSKRSAALFGLTKKKEENQSLDKSGFNFDDFAAPQSVVPSQSSEINFSMFGPPSNRSIEKSQTSNRSEIDFDEFGNPSAIEMNETSKAKQVNLSMFEEAKPNQSFQKSQVLDNSGVNFDQFPSKKESFENSMRSDESAAKKIKAKMILFGSPKASSQAPSLAPSQAPSQTPSQQKGMDASGLKFEDFSSKIESVVYSHKTNESKDVNLSMFASPEQEYSIDQSQRLNQSGRNGAQINPINKSEVKSRKSVQLQPIDSKEANLSMFGSVQSNNSFAKSQVFHQQSKNNGSIAQKAQSIKSPKKEPSLIMSENSVQSRQEKSQQRVLSPRVSANQKQSAISSSKSITSLQRNEIKMGPEPVNYLAFQANVVQSSNCFSDSLVPSSGSQIGLNTSQVQSKIAFQQIQSNNSLATSTPLDPYQMSVPPMPNNPDAFKIQGSQRASEHDNFLAHSVNAVRYSVPSENGDLGILTSKISAIQSKSSGTDKDTDGAELLKNFRQSQNQDQFVYGGEEKRARLSLEQISRVPGNRISSESSQAAKTERMAKVNQINEQANFSSGASSQRSSILEKKRDSFEKREGSKQSDIEIIGFKGVNTDRSQYQSSKEDYQIYDPFKAPSDQSRKSQAKSNVDYPFDTVSIQNKSGFKAQNLSSNLRQLNLRQSNSRESNLRQSNSRQSNLRESNSTQNKLSQSKSLSFLEGSLKITDEPRKSESEVSNIFALLAQRGVEKLESNVSSKNSQNSRKHKASIDANIQQSNMRVYNPYSQYNPFRRSSAQQEKSNSPPLLQPFRQPVTEAIISSIENKTANFSMFASLHQNAQISESKVESKIESKVENEIDEFVQSSTLVDGHIVIQKQSIMRSEDFIHGISSHNNSPNISISKISRPNQEQFEMFQSMQKQGSVSGQSNIFNYYYPQELQQDPMKESGLRPLEGVPSIKQVGLSMFGSVCSQAQANSQVPSAKQKSQLGLSMFGSGCSSGGAHSQVPPLNQSGINDGPLADSSGREVYPQVSKSPNSKCQIKSGLGLSMFGSVRSSEMAKSQVPQHQDAQKSDIGFPMFQEPGISSYIPTQSKMSPRNFSGVKQEYNSSGIKISKKAPSQKPSLNESYRQNAGFSLFQSVQNQKVVNQSVPRIQSPLQQRPNVGLEISESAADVSGLQKQVDYPEMQPPVLGLSMFGSFNDSRVSESNQPINQSQQKPSLGLSMFGSVPGVANSSKMEQAGISTSRVNCSRDLQPNISQSQQKQSVGLSMFQSVSRNSQQLQMNQSQKSEQLSNEAHAQPKINKSQQKQSVGFSMFESAKRSDYEHSDVPPQIQSPLNQSQQRQSFGQSINLSRINVQLPVQSPQQKQSIGLSMFGSANMSRDSYQATPRIQSPMEQSQKKSSVGFSMFQSANMLESSAQVQVQSIQKTNQVDRLSMFDSANSFRIGISQVPPVHPQQRDSASRQIYSSGVGKEEALRSQKPNANFPSFELMNSQSWKKSQRRSEEPNQKLSIGISMLGEASGVVAQPAAKQVAQSSKTVGLSMFGSQISSSSKGFDSKIVSNQSIGQIVSTQMAGTKGIKANAGPVLHKTNSIDYSVSNSSNSNSSISLPPLQKQSTHGVLKSIAKEEYGLSMLGQNISGNSAVNNSQKGKRVSTNQVNSSVHSSVAQVNGSVAQVNPRGDPPQMSPTSFQTPLNQQQIDAFGSVQAMSFANSSEYSGLTAGQFGKQGYSEYGSIQINESLRKSAQNSQMKQSPRNQHPIAPNQIGFSMFGDANPISQIAKNNGFSMFESYLPEDPSTRGINNSNINGLRPVMADPCGVSMFDSAHNISDTVKSQVNNSEIKLVVHEVDQVKTSFPAEEKSSSILLPPSSQQKMREIGENPSVFEDASNGRSESLRYSEYPMTPTTPTLKSHKCESKQNIDNFQHLEKGSGYEFGERKSMTQMTESMLPMNSNISKAPHQQIALPNPFEDIRQASHENSSSIAYTSGNSEPKIEISLGQPNGIKFSFEEFVLQNNAPVLNDSKQSSNNPFNKSDKMSISSRGGELNAKSSEFPDEVRETVVKVDFSSGKSASRDVSFDFNEYIDQVLPKSGSTDRAEKLKMSESVKNSQKESVKVSGDNNVIPDSSRNLNFSMFNSVVNSAKEQRESLTSVPKQEELRLSEKNVNFSMFGSMKSNSVLSKSNLAQTKMQEGNQMNLFQPKRFSTQSIKQNEMLLVNFSAFGSQLSSSQNEIAKQSIHFEDFTSRLEPSMSNTERAYSITQQQSLKKVTTPKVKVVKFEEFGADGAVRSPAQSFQVDDSKSNLPQNALNFSQFGSIVKSSMAESGFNLSAFQDPKTASNVHLLKSGTLTHKEALPVQSFIGQHPQMKASINSMQQSRFSSLKQVNPSVSKQGLPSKQSVKEINLSMFESFKQNKIVDGFKSQIQKDNGSLHISNMGESDIKLPVRREDNPFMISIKKPEQSKLEQDLETYNRLYRTLENESQNLHKLSSEAQRTLLREQDAMKAFMAELNEIKGNILELTSSPEQSAHETSSYFIDKDIEGILEVITAEKTQNQGKLKVLMEKMRQIEKLIQSFTVIKNQKIKKMVEDPFYRIQSPLEIDKCFKKGKNQKHNTKVDCSGFLIEKKFADDANYRKLFSPSTTILHQSSCLQCTFQYFFEQTKGGRVLKILVSLRNIANSSLKIFTSIIDRKKMPKVLRVNPDKIDVIELKPAQVMYQIVYASEFDPNHLFMSLEVEFDVEDAADRLTRCKKIKIPITLDIMRFLERTKKIYFEDIEFTEKKEISLKKKTDLVFSNGVRRRAIRFVEGVQVRELTVEYGNNVMEILGNSRETIDHIEKYLRFMYD